jgi:hypothetical protein
VNVFVFGAEDFEVVVLSVISIVGFNREDFLGALCTVLIVLG